MSGSDRSLQVHSGNKRWNRAAGCSISSQHNHRKGPSAQQAWLHGCQYTGHSHMWHFHRGFIENLKSYLSCKWSLGEISCTSDLFLQLSLDLCICPLPESGWTFGLTQYSCFSASAVWRQCGFEEPTERGSKLSPGSVPVVCTRLAQQLWDTP